MDRRPFEHAWPRARCAGTFCVALLVVAGLSGIARAQPGEAAPELDPLETMPDIGLPWPDLGADEPPAPPTEPQPPVEPGMSGPAGPLSSEQAEAQAEAARVAAIDPSLPLRYDVALAGLEGAADAGFHERFHALSELEKDADDEANLAQIARRARVDVELVERLLRANGHYDARASYALQVPDERSQRVRVVLNARPGPLYRLSGVSVSGLSPEEPREADLRRLFTVAPGDPANTTDILAATEAVREGLAEGGYPFAEVEEPILRVDHDERGAALDLIVRTGGFRRFGRISVTGDPPFGAGHVADIARFKSGEPYRRSEVADLGRALVATGLASSVDVRPAPGAEPDSVDVVVAMSRAPARTIAGELGYGTGEGARAELSWTHRNLFPPEGALTLRAVAGTQEQSASATFRRNNYRRRDRVLNGQIAFSNLDQAAYNARLVSISSSLEQQTNIIFQKTWIWSIGTEFVLSDERDLYGASQTPRRRTYLVAALPASLAYDGSDDLLDPTRGFRLSGRLSPELSLQAGAFGYVRAQMEGRAYLPASDRVTLAARAKLGSIIGASSDRIAPTRRFYAGGGGSVRGYSYQAIGPRDLNNDPVGGRSLAELSVEARFRFGSEKQFGLVPFVDAGTISGDALPSFKAMRVGAGLGLRYYSSFGPIRIDLGTPINPQPGDPKLGVYVSLGQAF